MLGTSTNLLLKKICSSKSWKVIFLGQWEFVDISFEGDPSRAIPPFLCFCIGMLDTSTNWLLKEICKSKSCKNIFLGQWGFVDISFEGDPPRAISPFLFFGGGMLGTSKNLLLKKKNSSK